MPTFVRQALDGDPLTVFGDGRQTRCFGYVKDVVESILRLVSCPAAVGEVVNIGNDEEISMEGLACMIKERTQSVSPIQFVSYDQAYAPGFEDMQRRVPSLEKLTALTGFRPTTGLKMIVDEVIAYFSTRKAESSAPAPVLASPAA